MGGLYIYYIYLIYSVLDRADILQLPVRFSQLVLVQGRHGQDRAQQQTHQGSDHRQAGRQAGRQDDVSKGITH